MSTGLLHDALATSSAPLACVCCPRYSCSALQGIQLLPQSFWNVLSCLFNLLGACRLRATSTDKPDAAATAALQPAAAAGMMDQQGKLGQHRADRQRQESQHAA
jgi:hypothetical protein